MENLVNLKYFESIFKGKKVFLTGHTGFKGTWMLCLMHLLGAEVKGFSLAPEQEDNMYNLIDGDNLCTSVIADIRDIKRLQNEIEGFKPDFIFHFAAQSLVRRSYERPNFTFDVNVMGTVNVLEALRHLKNPSYVVMITTDKVYENNEYHLPLEEHNRLGGYDPYSASKAASEIVIASYRNSFFNPGDYHQHKKSIASARAGNVIGGGDWSNDRIIPDIIRAYRNKTKIFVRNPNAIRPWQFVLEPLSGYLLLAARMTENPVTCAGAWNFGPFPEDSLTVKEIVETAIEHLGYGEVELYKEEKLLHETPILRLNINKAIDELGWNPRWKAAYAVKETMEWYVQPKTDFFAFTLSQIKKYFS